MLAGSGREVAPEKHRKQDTATRGTGVVSCAAQHLVTP